MIWFMIILLDRKDCMSMGVSLEVCVLFVDYCFVEYVWNIFWEMKMYKNCEKGLLCKVLEGIFLYDILYRKKSFYLKMYNLYYIKVVIVWF